MIIQVLVATMHQTSPVLVEKMNIQTDAIFANQCDRCSDEKYEINGKNIQFINRTARGVGQNRNTALLYSSGDILTFADEDMVFVDGYENIIIRAFEDLPDADAIIFNINTIGSDIKRRFNTKKKRIHFFNAFNYNTPRISVKSTAIRRENIMFHTCFGGGTRYNAGEDTLFIKDMLRNNLKIYVYPEIIGDEYQYTSTWFKGFDDKYLHDKGVLFAAISRKWAKLLCLQCLIRHSYIYKNAKISFAKAYSIMKAGIEDFRTLTPYKK